MNNENRNKIAFISVLAVAVAAFLGIVAFAVFSCLSYGKAAQTLMWVGVALSAVYLAASVAAFLFAFRGKRS